MQRRSMLSKLILIKACTYDLAEIDLSKGDSMQLVGGNNVGKSSLICALNFLFVINRTRMSFTGGRSGNKATMEYYFPEAEGSFLVFEISKKGRKHCLLVWRDGDGTPRYGRLSQAYSRERFFTLDSEAELRPLKLSQLRMQWAECGVRMKEIGQLKDVFPMVYQIGRNHDAMVSLRRNGSGRAAESFSLLYRYLINTQLINSRALQEILLLADHLDDTGINYRAADLAEIEQLRGFSERTRLLKCHQQAFERLREEQQQLTELEKGVQESLLLFNLRCTGDRAQLEEDRARHKELRQESEQSLAEAKAVHLQSNKQLGGLLASIKYQESDILGLEQQIGAIRNLPPADFLEEGIENLRGRVEELSYKLKSLEHADGSSEKLSRRIEERTSHIATLQAEHENCGNWLVHHLATDEGSRRRLNAVLNPRIARADAGFLAKAITCTEGNVTLYNGAFSLPSLSEDELPSPESLHADLTELRLLQQSDEKLLETARNREALKAELQRWKRSVDKQAKQLELIRTLPEKEGRLRRMNDQVRCQMEEASKLEQLIKHQQEDETRKQDSLAVIIDREKERRTKEAQITSLQRRIEGFSIAADPQQLKLPQGEMPALEQLFQCLETSYYQWKTSQGEVREEFTLLRRKLNAETADITAFLADIEQEYAGVDDVSATMNSLVASISKRFANPAADLLDKYNNFRDFINQKFNRDLARLTISNIEQLRIELVPNQGLQSDLKEIGNLHLGDGQLFSSNVAELNLLRKYIERGTAIAFTDLFTLQLKLRINGAEKVVDLSKQIESDGTDRMLRLVIVMQAISRMADLDADNRLVVFIDEIATIDGRNRPQLVEFCTKHHFYPIFAAPEMVAGFDRYVMINRAADNSIVVAADKHYIDVERD